VTTNQHYDMVLTASVQGSVLTKHKLTRSK